MKVSTPEKPLWSSLLMSVELLSHLNCHLSLPLQTFLVSWWWVLMAAVKVTDMLPSFVFCLAWVSWSEMFLQVEGKWANTESGSMLAGNANTSRISFYRGHSTRQDSETLRAPCTFSAVLILQYNMVFQCCSHFSTNGKSLFQMTTPLVG